MPEATATFADFVNAAGSIIGSFVDADGLYHAFARTPTGRFIILDYLDPSNLEYFFLHGINDAEGSGVFVIARAKAVGDRPRSYVGSYLYGLHELDFPGSVSTEGWNINQDGSVVGHYDTPDGRRHGFIAKLGSQVEAESYSNTYTTTLSKGLNMISVPLAPTAPMTAKSLVGLTGATTIITLDAATQQFHRLDTRRARRRFSNRRWKRLYRQCPRSPQLRIRRRTLGQIQPKRLRQHRLPAPDGQGGAPRSVGVCCQWTLGRQTGV